MQKIINFDSGVYLLEIFAQSDFAISKTKFKDILFRKGYYYYAGSAQRNLSKRVSRHLSKNKKLFWHIDYLLDSKQANINRIAVFPNSERKNECELIEQLQSIKSVIHPANNFGSSDCNICKSHLLFSKTKLNLNFISKQTGGFLFPLEKKNTFHIKTQ